MLSVVLITSKDFFASLSLVFLVSGPITLMSFLYLLTYPLVNARQRVRTLEKDLLFALRHGLIEIRSGVTLFDTMAAIARGGYGTVSDEFDKVIREINAGTPEEKALEKTAFENPSIPLREVIWQLSNAIKAGSDIAATFENLVIQFEKEQFITIQKYGKEMNPWTMMYMMLGIIMPSLGITFFIVISAFAGGVAGKEVFYLLIIYVIFFQVFFFSFMKTKRPIMLG